MDNTLQEDKRQFVYFMERIMAFITDAPSCEIAAWQASFALGTANCIGQNMASKAQEIGCSLACISKGATKVCRMLEIPPSPYMLSDDSRNSYRKLREKQEEKRRHEPRRNDKM